MTLTCPVCSAWHDDAPVTQWWVDWDGRNAMVRQPLTIGEFVRRFGPDIVVDLATSSRPPRLRLRAHTSHGTATAVIDDVVLHPDAYPRRDEQGRWLTGGGQLLSEQDIADAAEIVIGLLEPKADTQHAGIARRAGGLRFIRARRRKRILVSDNNDADRRFIVSSIRKLGYEVDEARTGEELLAAWREHSHPLVFVNGAMPQLDGWDAALRIRLAEQDSQQRITQIVGTAKMDLTHEMLFREALEHRIDHATFHGRWRDAGMHRMLVKRRMLRWRPKAGTWEARVEPLSSFERLLDFQAIAETLEDLLPDRVSPDELERATPDGRIYPVANPDGTVTLSCGRTLTIAECAALVEQYERRLRNGTLHQVLDRES